MKGAAALAGFLLLCYAVAAGGSVFTAAAVQDWYPTLAKPAWTPPSWLFAPVWTLLYTLMAIATWLVWRQRKHRRVTVALGVFGVQLGLNFLWSALFFGLRRPDLGLLDIILLWLAILATIIVFWRSSRPAAALLLPYLLWVSLASALNAAIWQMN